MALVKDGSLIGDRGSGGLRVWESTNSKHPAINIAGEQAEEGDTYGVELHIRRGAIVGLVITDQSEVVARHGLTPQES